MTVYALILQIESYEAVQLFVRRAQAVHSSFGLTQENAPAVAETCRLLSGLPLAIELAAARTRHMTPQVLAEQLARHRQLELLAGTTRDLPARHRTLKNAIEWSYELLDEGEQKVFRALSIFVGGCTLEALEEVCDWRSDPSFTSSAPGSEVSDPGLPDVVASLIAKSLLIQHGEPGDEPRLEMLEAIREYAQQRLVESGEANELCWRHARYYLSLVEEAEPELLGSGQGKWLARLDHDYSNIREVLDWAAEGVANEASGSREYSENSTDLTRSSLGLRMTAALWRYWLIHGYFGEGLEYLAKMLSSTESPAAAAEAGTGAGTGESPVPGYERTGVPVQGAVMALARAKSLLGMGHMTFVRGDYEKAHLLLEQSLALYRELAYKPGIAQTLGNLSLVAREEGHLEDAQTYMEQALLILQETGNRWGIANALRELGVVELYQGHNAHATTLFEQSLELLRELGQKWGMAYALVSLGVVMQLEGDSSKAESLLSESLLIGSELGDQHIIAQCLEGLASAAASKGDTTHAAQLWGAAQALRESVGAALSDFDRANHERDIEAARTQVVPGAWEAAWTEGYSQPLEYARQEGAKQQK